MNKIYGLCSNPLCNHRLEEYNTVFIPVNQDWSIFRYCHVRCYKQHRREVQKRKGNADSKV